jgi:hypothetical protein
MIKQVLPQSEREFLAVLKGDELKARVKALNVGGWSLGAIADAFTPPKQRSSIRVWATGNTQTRPDHPPIPLASPSSRSRSSSTILPAAEKTTLTTPTPSTHKRARRAYDPASPILTDIKQKQIQKLSPLARQYRARANPNGIYAKANVELTELCKDLYFKQNVSVRELSDAAGVTYRAMARRIGVGK